MWLETSTERSREEDQQRHEAFPDSAARRLGVRDDVRQEALHALHTETGKDLTETLSSALAVDAGRVCLESAEQAWNEIGEVHFA